MNAKKNITNETIVITQHPDYKAEIVEILRSKLTPRLMRERILAYHENDIAAALELLKKDERNKLYSILDTATLANILEYSGRLNEYISELSIRKRVKILSHLEAATSVEYLKQMEKADRNMLIELMEDDVRREITLLSSFDEDEIGSKMTTNFISVRNGNDQYLDNVIKGNEKVLVARLEDGEFFWREDQKLKIADLVERLKVVTFHEKIGSLYEHMERTKVIAEKLADLAGLSADEKADVARAADIYKFDLLTGMVGEFDELQGIMGEKYALLAGEKPAVAAAIREHYLPNSAEGELPESKVGAVLALADKFDTLLSFFSVGLIPSGSNDPYALRRATQGIVRILEAFGWEIPLDELIAELYSLNFASLTYDNQPAVMDFIRARVEKMMDKAIPKDIREAVLASSTFVVRLQLAASSAIFQKSKEADYKEAVENLSRVFNLAEKAEATAIDEALFENDQEKALAAAVTGLELTEDMAGNLDKLFALSPVIAAFFDNTMVMVDDAAVKANRLALLKALADKASAVAVFNLLNSK